MTRPRWNPNPNRTWLVLCEAPGSVDWSICKQMHNAHAAAAMGRLKKCLTREVNWGWRRACHSTLSDVEMQGEEGKGGVKVEMKFLAIASQPWGDIILLGAQWLAISKARVTMSFMLRLGVTFGMHEGRRPKTPGWVNQWLNRRTCARTHTQIKDNGIKRRTGVTGLDQATMG